MIHELKPSIEEAMSHHGVKGMKWGHTTGGSSGSGGGKKPKPTSKDILNARDRQNARLNRLNTASDNHALATSHKGKASAQKAMDKYATEYMNSSDAKIASKMTRGEKVGATIAYGISGALVISMIAGGR